jgi:hypothetical protein
MIVYYLFSGGASPDVSLIMTEAMTRTLTTKITSFLNLQPGWHYGDGYPSPIHVVHTALRWSAYLENLGLSDLDAFPGDSGEILLSAISGDHSIDVILEIDSTVSVAYDRRNVQQFYMPHVSEKEAREYVATLTRKIWSLSAGYTAIDSTRERIALPAWLLETPGTMGVSLSRSATVYIASGTQQVARSVNMPEPNIWNEVAAP